MGNREEKQKLFEFMGTVFYKNTLYKVENKLDLDAPEAWRVQGISKAPMTGDSASCKYVASAERYDTGFEVHSPRYIHKSDVEKQQTVDMLKKNIVKPFLAVSGKTEEELGMYNNTFWDDYSVKINEDISFNTSDPRKAMELYIAVTSGRLVPRGNKENDLEGDPYFGSASYIVYSESEKYEYKNVATKTRYEAVKNFDVLIEEDINKVKKAFYFMGFKVMSFRGKGELMTTFEKFIEPDVAKTKEFNDVCELINSPEGLLEVEIFYALGERGAKSKINVIDNVIYYNGFRLGETLKQAAKKLAIDNSEEAKEIRSSILIGGK